MYCVLASSINSMHASFSALIKSNSFPPEDVSPVTNGFAEESWSLMLCKIPSMVVKRPPRDPGLNSNSSSGIDSDAVSACVNYT